VESRVVDGISVVCQLNENAKPDRAFGNSFGKFVEQVVCALASGSSIVQMIVAGFRARRLKIGILLPELLLRGRDQPEIMFGVLKVIFRRDRIAGGLRVTRELKIFVGDMIGGAADLHVRPVGFIDPCQGIVIAAIVVVVAVVVVLIAAPTHALVVVMLLTVSHGLLFDNSNWRRLSPAGVFPSFNPAFCAGTKNPRWPRPLGGAPAGRHASMSDEVAVCDSPLNSIIVFSEVFFDERRVRINVRVGFCRRLSCQDHGPETS